MLKTSVSQSAPILLGQCFHPSTGVFHAEITAQEQHLNFQNTTQSSMDPAVLAIYQRYSMGELQQLLKLQSVTGMINPTPMIMSLGNAISEHLTPSVNAANEIATIQPSQQLLPSGSNIANDFPLLSESGNFAASPYVVTSSSCSKFVNPIPFDENDMLRLSIDPSEYDALFYASCTLDASTMNALVDAFNDASPSLDVEESFGQHESVPVYPSPAIPTSSIDPSVWSYQESQDTTFSAILPEQLHQTLDGYTFCEGVFIRNADGCPCWDQNLYTVPTSGPSRLQGQNEFSSSAFTSSRIDGSNSRTPSKSPSSSKKSPSKKKSTSTRKSPSPTKVPVYTRTISPIKSSSTPELDPRIKAFFSDSQNRIALGKLGKGIPKPEGLERATWRRCHEHRGGNISHPIIQRCPVCRVSRAAISLISCFSGKKLPNTIRYTKLHTADFRRQIEGDLRDLFGFPNTLSTGMSALRDTLTEQHCRQLEYIFDRVGSDLFFEWVR